MIRKKGMTYSQFFDLPTWEQTQLIRDDLDHTEKLSKMLETFKGDDGKIALEAYMPIMMEVMG